MIPKRLILPFIALLISVTALASQATLPHSSPSRQGVSGEALSQLLTDLRLLPFTELHHLVVLKHGEVVAESHASPYRSVDAHNQFSASKMLTALSVGIAVQDGFLSLEDQVGDICVRHLLTMTSGKAVNVQVRDTSDNWEAGWLSLPGTTPGKTFAYDTMSSFMLSAIVQRATGRTLLDLLNERIFQPMGITDVEWEQSPDGINTGGWGVRCSTLTMALLGQLILQRGQWNGQQLIDSHWVDLMTHDQLQSLGIPLSHDDDYHHGYGYQMWLNATAGTVRAQGNFGQLVYISPADSLVIAVNAATSDQLAILRVVQRDAPLLSCHQSSTMTFPNESLALPLPQGQCWSHDSDTVVVTLACNAHGIQSLELRRDSARTWLDICKDDGTSERIALGYNGWAYSQLAGTPPYNVTARNRFSGMKTGFSVAGAYAWHPCGQLVIQLHFVDWYSSLTLLIDLVHEQVTITSNTSSGRPYSVAITDVSPVSLPSQCPRWVWLSAFGLLFVSLVIAIWRS